MNGEEVKRLARLTWKQARRLVILVVGATIILTGVALLVLPGPGVVVIVIGMALLATEFVWAKRLLARSQDTASDATHRTLRFFGWRREISWLKRSNRTGAAQSAERAPDEDTAETGLEAEQADGLRSAPDHAGAGERCGRPSRVEPADPT